MISETFISRIQEVLFTPKRFAISIHTNPDGDAIGAALGLSRFLNKLGHEAIVVVPNSYPSFLQWMPQIDELVIFETHAKQVKKVVSNADYIFCLDYNQISRSGAMQAHLQNAAAPKILIDHHINPESDQFSIICSDVDVSSTAELVFNLFKALNLLHLLDADIATNLYVGIMTDTGSFSYALKNPNTYTTVAQLVQIGIDAERIHRLVYDTFSEDRLRLLGYAISQSMIVLDDVKTAIIMLSLDELNNFNYRIGDTEGLVNYPLSMEKINFSVLLTERKDQIKLSFRSKGSFNVNEFARLHFSGGGHFNAAGGSASTGLKETLGVLLKLLPQYTEQLNYVYS